MSRIAGMLTDFLLPQPCFMCSGFALVGHSARHAGALPVLGGRAVCAVRCRCRIQASAGLRVQAARIRREQVRISVSLSGVGHDPPAESTTGTSTWPANSAACWRVLQASKESMRSFRFLSIERVCDNALQSGHRTGPAAGASDGLPLIVDAAVREQDTVRQAGLDPVARRRKPQGAFRCVRPASRGFGAGRRRCHDDGRDAR